MQRHTNIHWSYYLSLEEDLIRLSRYIEIHENNFSTYSVELVRLFLSASSEVDVVFKEMCKLASPNENANNIRDYKKIIAAGQSFGSQRVISSRFGLVLTPWQAWSDIENLDDAAQHPNWWTEHNKVKHQRTDYFSFANLGNVLNAISGLYLLNIHLNHLRAKSITDFPLAMGDTVNTLLVQHDVFRIDCPFTYLNM